MKKINALLFLLIIIFLTIGIVSVIYNILNVVNVKDIEMDIKVGNKIGINADTDKIWFGMTNPGGSATRKTVISNYNNYPVIVDFIALGSIKEYVIFSENNVLLQPSEEKEVGITAYIPSDRPYGNYTGIMRVIFKKA